MLAWREPMQVEDGPPRWSPVPVVIAGLTITLIFWVGLREQEEAYRDARTQTTMETLAIQNQLRVLLESWGSSRSSPTPPPWRGIFHETSTTARAADD
jgi:hypothetical protein